MPGLEHSKHIAENSFQRFIIYLEFSLFSLCHIFLSRIYARAGGGRGEVSLPRKEPRNFRAENFWDGHKRIAHCSRMGKPVKRENVKFFSELNRKMGAILSDWKIGK